jgi:hypothetical protein
LGSLHPFDGEGKVFWSGVGNGFASKGLTIGFRRRGKASGKTARKTTSNSRECIVAEGSRSCFAPATSTCSDQSRTHRSSKPTRTSNSPDRCLSDVTYNLAGFCLRLNRFTDSFIRTGELLLARDRDFHPVRCRHLFFQPIPCLHDEAWK